MTRDEMIRVVWHVANGRNETLGALGSGMVNLAHGLYRNDLNREFGCRITRRRMFGMVMLACTNVPMKTIGIELGVGYGIVRKWKSDRVYKEKERELQQAVAYSIVYICEGCDMSDWRIWSDEMKRTVYDTFAHRGNMDTNHMYASFADAVVGGMFGVPRIMDTRRSSEIVWAERTRNDAGQPLSNHTNEPTYGRRPEYSELLSAYNRLLRANNRIGQPSHSSTAQGSSDAPIPHEF